MFSPSERYFGEEEGGRKRRRRRVGKIFPSGGFG